MLKATTFSNEKMTEIDFFNWMDFFRGVKVTIGNGKTVWTLASGYFKGGHGAVVELKRDDPRPNGFGYFKTTVDAERVRYFDGEGYLMASGNYEISNGTIKLIGS